MGGSVGGGVGAGKDSNNAGGNSGKAHGKSNNVGKNSGTKASGSSSVGGSTASAANPGRGRDKGRAQSATAARAGASESSSASTGKAGNSKSQRSTGKAPVSISTTPANQAKAAAPKQQTTPPARPQSPASADPTPAKHGTATAPNPAAAPVTASISPAPTSQTMAPAQDLPTSSPTQAASPAPANPNPTPPSHGAAPAPGQQTAGQTQGASVTPAPSQALIQSGAVQTGTPSVAEVIDLRPKPRQSTNLIVVSGLSPEDLARLAAQGFQIETQTRGSIAAQIVRLRVPQGTSLTQARQTVQLVDARASTDFDHFYYLDEHLETCTGAECQATALVSWSATRAAQCGPTPLIGLIDTGINLAHEALTGQAIEIVARPASHAEASLPEHGTAIAALLVGRPGTSTPGLMPEAKLVAVDAFYRDGGTADRTDVMSLVTAIEALAERGVRVINLSLSGPANAVLQKAIEAAQAKGIVIVAAAGNNGAGAEPAYPAAYSGVIAVTAVDQDLNIYRRATQGAYVDLSGPGVNVWTASAQGSGVLRTGTSYAVPFVSAAASLLLASAPQLEPKAVQAHLEQHTRDLGKPGWDPTYGYGLIDMAGLCGPPTDLAPVVATQTQPVAEAR